MPWKKKWGIRAAQLAEMEIRHDMDLARIPDVGERGDVHFLANHGSEKKVCIGDRHMVMQGAAG